MKKIFRTMLRGAFLLALPLLLTSCEDILGHWERPTYTNVTPSGGEGSTTEATAATITTTPTAVTVNIVAGSSTALVTIVTADGGTMMYKVTTANEKPTSTEGFSEEVPTAAGLEPGTYYVWYYAKGDTTHSDSEISATAIEVIILPTLSTPLTVEILKKGTLCVTSPIVGMQYSLNDGDKKPIAGACIEGHELNVGDKVQFYGSGYTITCYEGTIFTGGTAEVKVYGNIMSLLDEMGFANKKTLTTPNTFKELFKDNTLLKDASGLLLPATTAITYCYLGMFSGCSGLTKAPKELPATTLGNSCYFKMFYDCSALTTAPALPATNLVSSCYNSMFSGCTSLNEAWVKAAYTTNNNECLDMFNGCTTTGTARKLHTLSTNKASWDAVMPSTWATWTAYGDYSD